MTPTAQIQRLRHGIARTCAVAADEDELLAGVAARIRPVVGYDAAAWLVTDPDTALFTQGRIEQLPGTICQPWFDNELLHDDVNKFTELIDGAGTAVLSATVDPRTSPRWSTVMRPAGYDAELRSTFVDPTGCWAVVELHREVGRRDFTPDEAAAVDDIGGDIAGGLRRIAVERVAVADERADGPGLWFIADDGEVTGATEAGAAWLELIATERDGANTRTSMHALAALVRAETAVRPRRLRLRAADGRWVTLHASPLTDGAGTAVIVEPAPSHEIAAVLARAYGLSEREREVVLAVARGEGTDQIASRLWISAHTVRDHIKTAFTKVGVSSRTELVARLFTAHYADRLFAHAPD